MPIGMNDLRTNDSAEKETKRKKEKVFTCLAPGFSRAQGAKWEKQM